MRAIQPFWGCIWVCNGVPTGVCRLYNPVTTTLRGVAPRRLTQGSLPAVRVGSTEAPLRG